MRLSPWSSCGVSAPAAAAAGAFFLIFTRRRRSRTPMGLLGGARAADRLGELGPLRAVRGPHPEGGPDGQGQNEQPQHHVEGGARLAEDVREIQEAGAEAAEEDGQGAAE